jgi:hypothetical protein
MIMQQGEVSSLREKNDWDFGNNSWKVLSMRGFIPVCTIILFIIVKAFLTSRRKNFFCALLNPGVDGRKGKQKKNKTNYLI